MGFRKPSRTGLVVLHLPSSTYTSGPTSILRTPRATGLENLEGVLEIIRDNPLIQKKAKQSKRQGRDFEFQKSDKGPRRTHPEQHGIPIPTP